MAFSALFQFAPGDVPGMQRWLLEHYIEHVNMYKALLAQSPAFKSVNYPIQRMEDPKDWLTAHQKMSQSVWTGTGGGGQSTDFGSLDWEDPNAVQDWMNIHQLWHKTVRGALGL